MTYFDAQFTSSDPQEIEERMRARSVTAHAAGPVDYCASFRGDDHFSIGRSRASASMSTESTPDGVTITRTAGSSPWTSGGRNGDFGAGPVLFGKDRTYRSRSREATVATSATFDSPRLKTLARTYFGADVEVRLHEAEPMRSAAIGEWDALMELVRAAPLDQPLVRANAYRALAFTVCDIFTVVDDRKHASAAVRSRFRLFRRAADYLEANASRAIGVNDAAEEAGVGVQELRRLFSAYAPLGRSPEQYLRLRRLEGAHRELLHADPASTSVRAIRTRWGFAYSGTFVRLHLQHYGTLPHRLLE